MVERRGAGHPHQRLDGPRVVLELPQCRGLSQAELPGLQRVQSGRGLGHGGSGVDRVAVYRQRLGHPRGRDTGQQHLVDAAGPLSVGECCAVVVGDDLLGDPRRGGRLGVRLRHVEHIDRDAGQSGFAGGEGAALPIADFHAGFGAHGGDGLQHTVLADAGDELRLQSRFVADVFADQQSGGVEMFQGSGHDHLSVSGRGRPAFCLLALEISAGIARRSATVRARSSSSDPPGERLGEEVREPFRARSVSAGRGLARSRAPATIGRPEGKTLSVGKLHSGIVSAALGSIRVAATTAVDDLDGHACVHRGERRRPRQPRHPLVSHVMRERRGASRFFWMWLIVATSMSVTGNVAHALLHATAGTIALAAGAALVPPVVLLAATHSVALLVRTRAGGITYWCALAMTLALAACAFVLSFDALRSLAITLGFADSIAWLWPCAIDVAIAQATLCLLSLSRRGGVVATPATAQADRPKPVAEGRQNRRASPIVDRDAYDDKRARTTPPARLRSAAAPAASMAPEDPAAIGRWMSIAESIVQEGVTSKDPALVATILAQREAGMPPSTIGRTFKVHHTTVGRILSAVEGIAV